MKKLLPTLIQKISYQKRYKNVIFALDNNKCPLNIGIRWLCKKTLTNS